MKTLLEGSCEDAIRDRTYQSNTCVYLRKDLLRKGSGHINDHAAINNGRAINGSMSRALDNRNTRAHSTGTLRQPTPTSIRQGPTLVQRRVRFATLSMGRSRLAACIEQLTRLVESRLRSTRLALRPR